IVEPVQIGQVDGLGVRAEGLERHRLLHVGAAQLANPHVQRYLAALIPALGLAAGARSGALRAAAGSLSVPRAGTTADPLARLAGALRRCDGVQSDPISHRTLPSWA